MDDLRLYVLFNSIPVISGRCSDDDERLCAVGDNGNPRSDVIGWSRG